MSGLQLKLNKKPVSQMGKGVQFLNQTHPWELVVQAGQWRLLRVRLCKLLQTFPGNGKVETLTPIERCEEPW